MQCALSFEPDLMLLVPEPKGMPKSQWKNHQEALDAFIEVNGRPPSKGGARFHPRKGD